MKRQITLDGFSFVKTKQRYEIHVFLYMHVVPWVLKHNTELTNYQAKQFQSATFSVQAYEQVIISL